MFKGTDTVRLTDVERKLICGDPKTEGWKVIPPNEATYLLRSFLQARGYQQPRFESRSGRLEVDVGPKVFVRSVTVAGLPPELDPGRLRNLTGRPMTPKQLDRVKAALFNALQNEGYACPAIEVTGYGGSGDVFAEVVGGSTYSVSAVPMTEVPELDPGVTRRYEAFRAGDRFDMRLLTLSAQRELADSVFISAYYDVSCSSTGMSVVQRVVVGKPRLYRLGVGFDTEQLLIGRAQWRNSRVGNRADTLEASLLGSFREQSATALMRRYAGPSSRAYLMPQAVYKRLDEVQFDSINAEASILPASSWDTSRLRVDAAAGPAFDHVHTVRGPGAPEDDYFAFKTQVEVKDHLFEYYAAEPQVGWRASFSSSSRMAGAYSLLTAHRLFIQGEALWNLGSFDPPLVVLGTRYLAGSVYVNDRALALERLPPGARFYLGGDSDLRGAGRKELPGDDVGFLTAVYDGLELRLGDLAYGLEPLVFVDGAMAGRIGFHLDPDVYWSPGAGVRWRLPVGSIRGTVARGLVWHRDAASPPLQKPRWQLYFSFGKEF